MNVNRFDNKSNLAEVENRVFLISMNLMLKKYRQDNYLFKYF